jgi:hypothetical protein
MRPVLASLLVLRRITRATKMRAENDRGLTIDDPAQEGVLLQGTAQQELVFSLDLL